MAFGTAKIKSLRHINLWLGHLKSRKQSFASKGLYNIIVFLLERLKPILVFELLSENDYSNRYDSNEVFRKRGRIGFFANDVVYGSKEKQQLNERCLPDLVVTKHHDVCLFHGSEHFANLRARLLVNDYLAYNDNPNNSYEDRVTYSQYNRVLLLKRSKLHKTVEAGIMINGKFSYNYYHNMYENLILLLVVEEINDRIPLDLPIIIDEEIKLIPSFKRILEILTEKINRSVVFTKPGEIVEVGNLYHISSVNSLVPCHLVSSKGFDFDYTCLLFEHIYR